MEEIVADVNWVAVVIGAIVAFILGWLWYSPKLFGTKWAEGVGLTLEDTSKPCAPAMITQAIATLLLSWVVGLTAAHNTLLTMVLITITIVLLMIGGGLFSQKSSSAIAAEAGFVIAMVVVMIIVQMLL